LDFKQQSWWVLAVKPAQSFPFFKS
jgi:hypothetical protein